MVFVVFFSGLACISFDVKNWCILECDMLYKCRMDKGQTLNISYFHIVNPSTAVAAEMIHRFSSYENRFTIGSSHVVDPTTSVKTRLSDNGKVGMLCQREWRPKSLVTFSAEYDTKATNTASKFGIALALKP